jgi:hypothetical protein
MTPSGATFSACRRWRYLLWRCWDASRPAANFLMLNPSTADEVRLDPTCTRARHYAERWGFGAVLITNIFGWRATDPQDMKSVKNPVGRGNDAAIVKAAKQAKLVVCAWGNHGEHRGRGEEVLGMLARHGVDLHLLKLNGGGHPAHPLYLPATLAPQKLLTNGSGTSRALGKSVT